jgi:hypothetical protein
MRHPYFELDLATRGTHPIGHAHRIIAANFVTPHLDNCRRQTGGIAVEGRRKGTRISAGERDIREQAGNRSTALGRAPPMR